MKTKIELTKDELKYLVGLMYKDFYNRWDSDVSFEGGYVDRLYSKLLPFLLNNQK